MAIKGSCTVVTTLIISCVVMLCVSINVAEGNLEQERHENGVGDMKEKASIDVKKLREGNPRVVMAAEVLHRDYHPSSPFGSSSRLLITQGKTQASGLWRFVEKPTSTLRRSRPLLHQITNSEQQQLDIIDGAINIQGPVDGTATDMTMQYFVDMEVGSPPKSFSLMLDTGSSLTWLQCRDGFNRRAASAPFFNGTLSSSFDPLVCPSLFCSSIPGFQGCNDQEQCTYDVGYIDGASTRGILVEDHFRFKEVDLQPIMFGCANEASGMDNGVGRGMLGLGADFISFPSQMSTNLFFCLPARGSPRKGVLGLGDLERVLPNTVFTKLIHSERYPSLHMVPWIGISIDGSRLAALDASSFTKHTTDTPKDGEIVDSGAVVSYVFRSTYLIIHEAFLVATKARRLQKAKLDNTKALCYALGSEGPTMANTPSMELHFEGGANIVLPPQSVFIPYTAGDQGTYCLAFDISPIPLSILGSVQLSTFLVEIDNEKMTVGFTPNYC